MKNITNKKCITSLIKKFISLVAFTIFILLYNCPIKMIFKIDCPGCGMTRAFKALAALELAEAFNCHPLFPIPIICVIYQLFRKKIHIGQEIEILFIIMFLLAFIIRWIYIFL